MHDKRQKLCLSFVFQSPLVATHAKCCDSVTNHMSILHIQWNFDNSNQLGGEKKLSTIWVITKNVSYHCCLRTLYVWIFFMPSVYFKKNVESHWNFTHRYKNIPSGAIILTNNNNIVIAEFTNVSSQNII